MCGKGRTMDRLKEALEKLKRAVEEKGRTSIDHEHWHEYTIDDQETGKTLSTVSTGTNDITEHVHKIKRGVVQKANKHTHEIE